MLQRLDIGTSRRDTTRAKTAYLEQLPLGAELGRRGWVHRALRLRVADSTADRSLVRQVLLERHYLGRWPAPPRTLILSLLAELDGCDPGPAGAAAVCTIALLPAAYPVSALLAVHKVETLTLCRLWRADDLGPELAPDFVPEVLRRAVRGCERSGLRPLAAEWSARKLREGGLRAAPRLLVTHADPERGHDGAVYLGAGATPLGQGVTGKLGFAWALDPTLRAPLQELGARLSKGLRS